MKQFTAMHYSDVVGHKDAVVESHVVVDGGHYILIGFAAGRTDWPVLKRLGLVASEAEL